MPIPFQIDQRGWLAGIERVESPNFDARPDDCPIRLIVVHGISLPPGEYGGPYIRDLFCNRLDPAVHDYFAAIYQMRVSAHCLVEREGHLVQFVSFDHRAWHAGESSWQGLTRCNDFSVGIELEGCDDEAYTDAQYQTLASLIQSLRNQYSAIDRDALVGHSDIAPARKTDPGPAFDWEKLRQLV